VETRVAHKEARLTAVHRPQERRLALSGAPIEAKVVLRLEGWRVDAPQSARPLLTVDQFNLAAGDRVALLGANGAGKSTLLGALAAAYAARPPHPAPGGAVRFNPAARLAFFDQHLSDPPPWIAPLDYLLGVPGVDRQDAVRHLVQAGFALRRMEEPVSAFSPGERTRLAFLKMKLAAPNLYLLDEPTNHLDIEGQEALEEELERSEVACLLVSHDRYFVRTAATRFVEIRRNKLFEVDDPEAFFDAEAARGLAPAA
jgi:ATPase subunit of ABC transporter with duplicated ATPase domains